MTRTYQITPRPETLGGGWSLKLFEDGEEMGGGVFPLVANPEDPDFDEAYQDALDEGERWGSEEPAFLDDDGPSAEIPPFVTTTNSRELYDLRPGETIQQAMARRKAEQKDSQ